MLNSPVEEIKNRLDIVDVIRGYIKVHKAGANYRAVCPFHNEKKPSFFISPSKQIWHCFGSCSDGGDMFKFVMKIEGVEFGDALRILAQKAGVELKKQDPKLVTEKQRMYEVTELACKFFETQLEKSQAGKEAKKYLLDRGVKEETISKWRLGYSPDVWQGVSDFLKQKGYRDNEIEKVGLSLKGRTGRYYDRFRGRIIFPIFDLSSQPIAFGGRIFKNTKRDDGQEEAKYINSPATPLYDKSRILYGLNKSGIDIRKKDSCLLVEGYMDVIMASQSGFENVVATSGTALTSYQLRILKRYTDNILTAFDMDLAGNSATKRGIDLAQAEGFNIKIVTMPQGKDPADVSLEDPKKMEELINKAKSIHDFYFETTFSDYDKDTIEGKKNICKILLPVIKKIPNKIEQSVWVQSLANKLGVKEDDVIEELNKTKEEYQERSTEEVRAVSQKSRKEMLEEMLSLLIIKEPQNASLIKEEDLRLFSLNQVELFDYFRQNNGKIELVPENLKEKINQLSLKAEVELASFDFKQEFKDCLLRLKELVVKENLSNISLEIRRAEEEKDFEKVEKLIQDYNEEAKLLCIEES